MISIHHLLANPDIYKSDIQKRFGNTEDVDLVIEAYNLWKLKQKDLDVLRMAKNDFNKLILSLSADEKKAKIEEMKETSLKIKNLEGEVRELKESYESLILKIPNFLSEKAPIGKSDKDNPVIQKFGEIPKYDFTPKPYWELETYKKNVFQDEGVKAMGSRGYYLKGDIALFQKVLFDYALEIVLKHGFELFYVPLMLNEQVLTGTGHLPDFDGQQYEIPIDENKSFYLVGSSEPSIMGFFMNKNLDFLDKPILATCWSSCFRKEAGSYGKDQQGILRVHQFEKVEMVAICKPKEAEDIFQKLSKIEEEIYAGLGIHYQAVEVCTGDLPAKHCRQIDYEAWFPSQQKYREICSNGNASDYQNRGLNINYKASSDQLAVPWGLNCTAITFRTGLAILEQFQTVDGSVNLPEVLAQKMGKKSLK